MIGELYDEGNMIQEIDGLEADYTATLAAAGPSEVLETLRSSC